MKQPVNPLLVDILLHFLADKEGVDVRQACPTEPFWNLFVQEFGLENGQGLIASNSSSYIRKVWRKKFTTNQGRAPHKQCMYCPPASGSSCDRTTTSFNCPLCSTSLSTWESLRCHIQKKHKDSAKTLITDLKKDVSLNVKLLRNRCAYA